MKLDEDFIANELSDYERGYPTWGLRIAGDIDNEVCAESKCTFCGHLGVECHPFINERIHSYRAFAVCPACGEAEEF